MKSQNMATTSRRHVHTLGGLPLYLEDEDTGLHEPQAGASGKYLASSNLALGCGPKEPIKAEARMQEAQRLLCLGAILLLHMTSLLPSLSPRHTRAEP
ncbi:hypothetical protein E2C01_044041 [Portunus trituberculatus]|uniref:Uncharacterized protein n=1 Tax=Portunus trituberculatus TaxID=210409 RepID=A0A5B7FZB9_PORTR|nr:hypothetical protein [Portunus trituberculatus]